MPLSSVIQLRPRMLIDRSVPVSVIILRFLARRSLLATRKMLLRISLKSAVIPPSSIMCTVMPGIVAILAPLFVALRLAIVWDIVFSVVMTTTSASFINLAIGIGGSMPSLSKSGILARMVSAPISIDAWYNAWATASFESSVNTRTLSPFLTFKHVSIVTFAPSEIAISLSS